VIHSKQPAQVYENGRYNRRGSLSPRSRMYSFASSCISYCTRHRAYDKTSRLTNLIQGAAFGCQQQLWTLGGNLRIRSSLLHSSIIQQVGVVPASAQAVRSVLKCDKGGLACLTSRRPVHPCCVCTMSARQRAIDILLPPRPMTAIKCL
jgi:hypothetical protein